MSDVKIDWQEKKDFNIVDIADVNAVVRAKRPSLLHFRKSILFRSQHFIEILSIMNNILTSQRVHVNRKKDKNTLYFNTR